MKSLLMLPTLTLSLMFSAGSWAEWTEAASTTGGGVDVYVDFDRIKKTASGLVYYWTIEDYLEPNPITGDLSVKVYQKADCEAMRTMWLSFSSYKLPMAEGTAEDTITPNPWWDYARPDGPLEATLQAVCAH